MDTLALYKEAIGVRSNRQLSVFFQSVTEFAVKFTGAQSASLWIAEPAVRKVRCQAVYFRESGSEIPRKSFRYDEVTEGWVIEHFHDSREPFVANDPQENPQCSHIGTRAYRNILIIPFAENPEESSYAAGTLTLLNQPNGFSPEHVAWGVDTSKLLSHAFSAAETAEALYSAKISLKDVYMRRTEEIEELHRALRARHEEQVTDLKLAARIHNSLWKIQIQPPDPFRIESRFRASTHLGGDLIDLYRTQRGTHGLIIADVSGTGVAACLLAYFAREAFRRAMDHAGDAKAIMKEAAGIIDSLLPQSHYLTAIVALFSPSERAVEICVAGHPAPIRFGGGKTEEVSILGDAIGISNRNDFGCVKIELKPRERLLFYTDGIIEVSTADRKPFGLQRLMNLLTMRGGDPLPNLANLILRAGEIYVGTNETLDDQSLVLVETD